MSSRPRTGVLVDWNDERGFGFIERDGKKLFVHVSAFDLAHGRPRCGDFIGFETGPGKDGRPQAVRASRVYTLPAHAGPAGRRRRGVEWFVFVPVLLFGIYLALTITALGTSPWSAAAYLLASLATFALYAQDKRAARAGAWRTPEDTLHVTALLGGWPGAVLAQQLLRHKNRKTSFQIRFWAASLVNVLGFIALTNWPTVTLLWS